VSIRNAGADQAVERAIGRSDLVKDLTSDLGRIITSKAAGLERNSRTNG
jgi:hypothetical protein